MIKTGIFYHLSFSRRSYLTIGNRLADFPDALRELIAKKEICVFECKPVDEELLLKVHTKEMIEEVKKNPFCATARLSAGGVVEATEKILKKDILNAFCFIGSGGHHAGKDYFWGACCFNDVILAIVNAREKIDKSLKFAILDTDAHHGDGTRELLEIMNDKNTLHICLCDRNWESHDKLRIDIDVTWVYYNGSPDESYINTVKKTLSIIKDLQPDLIFWYFGFDTYKGDYGSLGLSKNAFIEMAKEIKEQSKAICDGRLQVVLAGGSMREVATWTIPRIINILAED